MGAGKSTVASTLHDLTGWPIHDNDVVLATLTSATADEIEAETSVSDLHRLEAAALDASLEAGPGIVTAAASTLDLADLPDRLAAAPVPTSTVWLDGDPATLAQRAGTGAHRPSARIDVDHLRAQSAARTPMLERIADLRLDTTAATPNELAEAIVEHLGPTGDPSQP